MERRCVAVRGTVQGVGFRPYIYRLAEKLELAGFVRNRSGDVQIEVEGETPKLEQFLDEIANRPPAVARIDEISWKPAAPLGATDFEIEESDGDAGAVNVTPDIATCDACLAELFDPSDRRYCYPFLNCAHCGPRLTIQTGAPYDRERTTMAAFAMCEACRTEYQDPADRRFHAQPIACPVCGPKLTALDSAGSAIATDDVVTLAAEMLRAGKIVAIKGLGGYHLAGDARNSEAVKRLRQRKLREEKPLAVMVENLATGLQLCEIDEREAELLNSRQRPIVLLRKKVEFALAADVAPGNPFIGVMLASTPLHYLILRELGDVPLVMTSGNRSDEPIAIDEEDAVTRLTGIADAFITHNRPIFVRCDDSVTRIIAGEESPVRRSRGYAPQSIAMPVKCDAPILAVGGQMKVTFGVALSDRAVLSHHIGDLSELQACEAFERDIALYEQLFSTKPGCIAHDLHPDYFSTQYAVRRAAKDNIPCMGIQHHHAHIASCMAENGLTDPVIGVAFDGTGFGEDGAIWGGEFLVADYREFRRAAHLRYIGLPGGERAIREPWRTAIAHLTDADAVCDGLDRRIPESSRRFVRGMLEKGVNSPVTSSAGRLFDAIACLLGVRDTVSYEGQAAVELEWLASQCENDDASYSFDISAENGMFVIDTRPVLREIAEDIRHKIKNCTIARCFHRGMVDMVVDVCSRIRATCGIATVALSGGVFMNALLTTEVAQRLSANGFAVYRHRVVPANDGGLALGQLAIAAARISE